MTGWGTDAVGIEVMRNRFAAVADEMGAVLRRSAYSPNIKEREDCSAAVFTGDGELLAQVEHIPVHLGSMPASVAAILDRAGDHFLAGDVWAVNDPFAGGTHLNDLTIVEPVLVNGDLVAFVANRAHHADVGGAAPGSMWAAATEIFQEGLRIPPLRIGRRGLLDPIFVTLLTANSRTPDERIGDLHAQHGACRVGTEGVAEIVGELGWDAVRSAMVASLDYSERRMRAAIDAIPDGEYRFTDVCEMAQTNPESAPSLVRIALALRVSGTEIVADFTGSDDQVAGNLNAVEAVTKSAVYYAVRCFTDPDIPATGGCYRPVTVIAPSGSVVGARHPAAAAAGNVEVSQRIADVCTGAFSKALPDRARAAGHGSMNNLLLGGAGYVYYETTGGGDGGGADGPGAHAVQTAMTNTKNTPIEALEHAYPVRVTRYEIRRGSGGDGRHPGGDGIVREIAVLGPATASLVTERRAVAPWGLEGGAPGAPGVNTLVRADGSEMPLAAKVTLDLEAGDAIRIESAGGGGWGAASPT